MGGKRCLELIDSNHQKKKCIISRDDDMINKLSDDILLHILSFLRVKDVVTTSLISQRWSHLWKYTPNLIFKNYLTDTMINIPVTMPDRDPNQDQYKRLEHNPHFLSEHDLMHSLKNIEWVNSVLNSYKGLSLNKVSFRLFTHNFQDLPKWLHFALSRRVETLELDFPDTWDTLRTLDFNINNLSRNIIPTGGGCKFLKELVLSTLQVSGEVIELFLRNCPSLERLFIKDADVMSDLIICGGSLKHLILLCRSDPPIEIKICAPNLSRLECDCHLEHLFLQEVPNLVDTSISFEGPETMHLLAKQAPNFESLIISLSMPTAFTFPQMPKLKKLVLDYFDAENGYLLPVTSVLDASPFLQEFTLQCDGLLYHDMSVIDYERRFQIPESGFKHTSLQVFEFSPFCERTADHMELLKLIASNCIALREITIWTKTNDEDRLIFDHTKRIEQMVAAILPNNINWNVF